MRSHPRGSAVIEVLISLSLGAFLIVVLGNLISSVRRLEMAQDFRQRALAHTRESLEMVTSLQNELFACTSATPGPGTCTNALGTCTLAPAYNSCWVDLGPTGPFHLADVGGNWQLVSGSENIASDQAFTRYITVANVAGEVGRKQVTTRVTWQERGDPKSLQLATRLTAWANYNPSTP